MKDLMTNTLVLGLGQAGGNVTSLAYERNILTAAINTSQKDLYETNAHIKIHMSDIDGSGKDRDFSFEMFKENYQSLLQPIFDLIDSNDINNIAIVASGTGGTGSGIFAPVLAFLNNKYGDKLIYGVAILGSIKEDYLAQSNAKEFLKEVDEKLSVPYMIFDNDSVEGNVHEVYKTINNDIINKICVIDGYMYDASDIANIDNSDKTRLYKSGRFLISTIDNISTSLTNDIDAEDNIISSIRKSHQTDIGEFVDTYGIYINSNDLNKFDYNFVKLQNEFGQSVTMFKHIQLYNGKSPEIAVIMTGLESPVDRFNLIDRRMSEYESKERRALPNSNKMSIPFGERVAVEKINDDDDLLGLFTR